MTRTPDPVTRSLWFGLVAAMSLIPMLAIPLGLFAGVPKGIGWTGNFAIPVAFFFALAIRGNSKTLFDLRERLLLVFVLGFSAYAIIGLGFGPNNLIISLASIIGAIGGYGAGLGAYTLARSGEDPLSRLWFWSIIGMIPLTVLPFLVQANFDSQTSREWMLRLYGFSNVRSLGHYTTVAVTILIGLSALMLADTSTRLLRRRLAWHFAGLAMMWSLLFWSGSRGGIMALGLGIPFACLILGRLRLQEVVYNGAAAAAGALLSLFYVIPHAAYGVFHRLAQSAGKMADSSGAGLADELANGRAELWAWTLERIAERPWFGWSFLPMSGIDIEARPKVAHAHNVILDYLIGYGIPVASLVFAVVGYLWLRAALAARARPTPGNITALYLMTMLPIYSMVSAVLIAPYQLILFGICIGGLIGGQIRDDRAAGESESASADHRDAPADTVFL